MLEIESHHVVDDLMGPDEYGEPNKKCKQDSILCFKSGHEKLVK